ncbi:MAG: glycosyltransferase, partial [Erysipelotrichaceae bacterium]
IKALGGTIVSLPLKLKHPIRYRKALKELLSAQRYDIVHSHMDAMNYVALKVAKQQGIPVRISHSHNTQHQTKNALKLWLNNRLKARIPSVATHLFACSKVAGEWLYGAEMVAQGNVSIINNAIDVERFAYKEQLNAKLRQQHGLTTQKVVGHVGRFDHQKNHTLLVALFAQVAKQVDAVLVLIGAGPLEAEIKAKVMELGIEDRVIFTGAIGNVYEYFNLFDVFVLPSLFEGLPVVSVEAQANGLPCIYADTITDELVINDNTYFVSNQDQAKWVETIVHALATPRVSNAVENVIAKGFSIHVESKKLQAFYLESAK